LDRRYRTSTQRFEFLSAGPAKELTSVSTVRPPLFLLPTTKAGGAIGDFFLDLIRHILPHSTATNFIFVGETGFKFLVRGTIRNAPGTDAVIKFFDGVQWAYVNEAGFSPAT
jgi:hypothetical protein